MSRYFPRPPAGLVTALITVLAMTIARGQQEDQPAFRTGVDLVSIRVLPTLPAIGRRQRAYGDGGAHLLLRGALRAGITRVLRRRVIHLRVGAELDSGGAL